MARRQCVIRLVLGSALATAACGSAGAGLLTLPQPLSALLAPTAYVESNDLRFSGFQVVLGPFETAIDNQFVQATQIVDGHAAGYGGLKTSFSGGAVVATGATQKKSLTLQFRVQPIGAAKIGRVNLATLADVTGVGVAGATAQFIDQTAGSVGRPPLALQAIEYPAAPPEGPYSALWLATNDGAALSDLDVLLNLSAQAGGSSAVAALTSTTLRFSNGAQVLPGDFDLNGLVNAFDYSLWRANYGSPDGAIADANGDRVTNAADYTTWRDNLNHSAVEAKAVPECVAVWPTAACIALFWRSARRVAS